MTDKLKDWSATAASNNATPPYGWPEGMAPSAVNNTARQDRASVAEWYADPEWVRYAHSITSSTSSTVVITGDVTADYVADRAVRLDQDDAKVGYVSSSSYSAPNTTVTITGLTVASPTIIEVGAIKSADSLPSDIDAGARTYADEIAQRAGGATYLNGIGTIASITTGSGNWTVPDGVYRVKYTITGGGGGGAGIAGSASNGSDGGNTVFNSTIIAAGGSGGVVNGDGGVGGIASGGAINIDGGGGSAGSGTAASQPGGASIWGGGAKGRRADASAEDSTVYGSGGPGAVSSAASSGGGGAGATCIGILSVTPAQLIPYSVGAGGAGGTGTRIGGDGGSGFILLEY